MGPYKFELVSAALVRRTWSRRHGGIPAYVVSVHGGPRKQDGDGIIDGGTKVHMDPVHTRANMSIWARWIGFEAHRQFG